jgi:hypothetical protein
MERVPEPGVERGGSAPEAGALANSARRSREPRPEHPFRNLGARLVRAGPGTPPAAAAIGVEEVELTLREHSGTEGFQQLLRPSSLAT